MKSKLRMLLAGLALIGLASAEAATVKMDCNPAGASKDYCAYIKQRFESETPHKLEFIALPSGSDDKLSLVQQIFASKDGSIVDVLSIDTVWVGLLNRHLADLTDKVKDLEPSFFPAVWKNNTVNGRVKAVPAFLDAGMFFYRKDLLDKYKEQPPQTWEEMGRIALKIQTAERAAGQKNLWGFVFQGKSYEGLTCDALEWVASYGGGSFIDEQGKVTVNNPQAAKALDTAAGWIGKISPKGVMGYMEEESRAVFQNGDAIFMRNWPYAFVLAQDASSPIRGKVGIMPLPKGGDDGRNAATIGGWQWGVSAYSQNPDAAIALVRLLVEEKSQKKAFMITSTSPPRPALYADPEILAKAPHLAQFKDVFASAIARPATPTKAQFPAVSKSIFNAAYNVLSGRATGTAAVAELEGKLKRIKGREWK